ncbi:hypothetical protein DPMN_108251 [Dreissena polymorpha]|uniref:Uncharacterized protein n=1 Tax=Dreissena polymorpha TaxID=45954 RepID=A0A9D4K8F4_DREPO|nr:hypothetical protein DPMN_108251 [Dreissena polymorpha]
MVSNRAGSPFVGMLVPMPTWTAATRTLGIPNQALLVEPPVPAAVFIGTFGRILAIQSLVFIGTELLNRLSDAGIIVLAPTRVRQSPHRTQQPIVSGEGALLTS